MLELIPEFTSQPEVLLAACAFGYLTGSIPFGIIISKILGLGDLRKVGSGNIGATNVLRTGNKLAAFLTLLFDFSKGICAVLIVRQYLGEDAVQISAFSALAGHCFPIWLKFRGGKGVATFLGVTLALFFITNELDVLSLLTVYDFNKDPFASCVVSFNVAEPTLLYCKPPPPVVVPEAGCISITVPSLLVAFAVLNLASKNL